MVLLVLLEQDGEDVVDMMELDLMVVKVIRDKLEAMVEIGVRMVLLVDWEMVVMLEEQ